MGYGNWGKVFGPVATLPMVSVNEVGPRGEKLFISSFQSHFGSIFDIPEWGHQVEELDGLAKMQHKSGLLHAVFGRSSNALLTSSWDCTVRFRDLTTFEQRGSPLRFLNPVMKLLFGPLEKELFTMHPRSGVIGIWSPPDPWNNQVFLTSGDSRNVIFTSDGHSAVALTQEGLRPFSLEIGVQEESLFGKREFRGASQPRSFDHVISNPVRKSLLVLENGVPFIRELDEKSLELIDKYKSNLKGVICSGLSADGRYLALVSKGAPSKGLIVSVFDLDNGMYESFPSDLKGIVSVEFSSTGSEELILLSSSRISWANWRNGEIVREKKYGERELIDIDVCHEKGLVAVGNSDRTVTVFKESSWESVSPKLQHEERVSSVEFIDGGRFVVIGEKNTRATIRDVSTGTPVGPPLTHDKRILHIQVCDKNNTIITVCSEGVVKVWPGPEMDKRDISVMRDWLEDHIYIDF